ncbi:hypothetical protein [Emcibacter sp. SYSU 3D8]|uniref:beta strand repeat-containing protein n=1 Tax=Emcibacter sp. SYSU 3D8 TaxID=3133969 RepID=UPI0031FEA0EA
MKFNLALTAVSAIALATAAGVSGARADNILFDLSLAPTLTAPGASSVIDTSVQNNTTTSLSATNAVASISIPLIGPQDVEGGTVTVLEDFNTIFALAVGNAAISPVVVGAVDTDPGTFVDLYTATGTGTTSAATAATLQSNVNLGAVGISATTSSAEIRSEFDDLGTGSSVILDNNAIVSDGRGNQASTMVAGDINPGLSSAEAGQSTLTNPGAPDEVVAGATILAASAQLNANLAVASATVGDSRIGTLATVDGTPAALAGVNLDLTNSLIRADFTGNDAATSVNVGNDGKLDLVGTAGVTSVQLSGGDVPFSASVTNSVVEAGESATSTAIADLAGSSLTFTGNDIIAQSTANTSANSLNLADGVNQAASLSTQANTYTGGSPDIAEVGADLFVQNGQYSLVDAAASDQGDMFVLTEDLDGATVTASSNSIGAAATANATVNDLQVEGATTFGSIAAVQSIQYAENLQTADTGAAGDGANLQVSIASLAGAAGDIVGTEVLVEDNRLFSKAMGNVGDSAIVIDGTTVGDGTTGSDLADYRSSPFIGASAEVSLLNGQVLDGGGAQSTTISNIRVNSAMLSPAGSEIDTAHISTSNNEISALTVGNLSTGASVDITGNSVTLGAIAANSQTVEDGASLTAQTDSPSTNQSQLEVWGFPQQIADSSINTDGNVFSARVFGNLSDGTGTSLDVAGTTIVSGSALGYAATQRGSGVAEAESVSDFIVLNDQAVEDLEGAIVTATNGIVADGAQGDLVFVRIGLNPAFALTDSKFTANGNAGVVSATLNQATSSLSVDAATTLDAMSSLINMQSVADDDGDGNSAALIANQYDADITLSVGRTGDGSPESITGARFEIDGNELLASGRINLATNTLSVEAQTQAPGEYQSVGNQTAAIDGSGMFTAAAHSLVNDQWFVDLGDAGSGAGLDVVNDNSDFSMVVGTAGAFTNNVAEIDGNAMTIQALGNDASNRLALDIGTLSAPVTGSAPFAMLVSNQGSEVTDTNNGFSALGDTTRAILDLSGVAGAISDGSVTIDGNEMRAVARVNNVSNVLTATGTSLPNINPADTQFPTAEVYDSGSGDIVTFTDSVFGLASNQVNSHDVTAALTGSGGGTPVGMRIIADGAPTITGTDLSASGNSLIAEARGSDSSNLLVSDYVTNYGQAFLANVQSATDEDPSITADVFDIEILVDVDGDTIGISPALDGVSISLEGNGIGALASSNRTANTLSVTGTNILSSFDVAPSASISAGGAPMIGVTGDIALINMQGSPDFTSPNEDEDVYATVDTVNILADVATFNTGSLTVDNNAVLSQAMVHSASNLLSIAGAANIGAVDETPSAALVSVQTISDDGEVEALTTNVTIGAADAINSAASEGLDAIGSSGSVAASVSGNSVASTATGGTATNRLTATAGAAILGGVTAPAPSVGFPGSDDINLDADYSLLNMQTAFSDEEDIASEVSLTGIGIVVDSDAVTDALTVDNNMVIAQTRGFYASNALGLDAGSSSDATAQVASIQVLDGFAALSADADEIAIGLAVAGSGLDSSANVAGNQVQASVSGNTALNSLATIAGAALQEEAGAGVSIDPGASTEIGITGAEYAVLNRQSVSGFDEGLLATASDVTVGIDGFVGGVTDSVLNVSGNEVGASSIGNDAVNSLVLNTGTFEHPSAAVANLQTISGTTISATVTNTLVGIGSGVNISGVSNNSTLKVQGNTVGATAIGNRATNSIGSN